GGIGGGGNGGSEEERGDGLWVGLMLTAGRSGRFHGRLPGRSVILGMAVSAGVRAAQAARRGVGGDPDLLDGPWLRDAHGLAADVSSLIAGLGSSAGSVYAQLSLKPFCSAKQAIAAIEALATLIDEGGPPDAMTQGGGRVP